MSKTFNSIDCSGKAVSSTLPGSTRENRRITFPQILWNLLDTRDNIGIRWSVSGQTIEIHVEIFQNFLNKKMVFSTTSYASFLRQLHMYEFKKVNTCSELQEYRHPYFQQGKLDLLKQVKRKSKTGSNSVARQQGLHLIINNNAPSQLYEEKPTNSNLAYTSFSHCRNARNGGYRGEPFMTPQRVLGSTSLYIDESDPHTCQTKGQYYDPFCSSSAFVSPIPVFSPGPRFPSYGRIDRRDSGELSEPIRRFGQLYIPSTDEADCQRVVQNREPLDYRKNSLEFYRSSVPSPSPDDHYTMNNCSSEQEDLVDVEENSMDDVNVSTAGAHGHFIDGRDCQQLYQREESNQESDENDDVKDDVDDESDDEEEDTEEIDEEDDDEEPGNSEDSSEEETVQEYRREMRGFGDRALTRAAFDPMYAEDTDSRLYSF